MCSKDAFQETHLKSDARNEEARICDPESEYSWLITTLYSCLRWQNQGMLTTQKKVFCDKSNKKPDVLSTFYNTEYPHEVSIALNKLLYLLKVSHIPICKNEINSQVIVRSSGG